MTTLDLRAPARSQWLALADALRVHQWVKNLLVLVPVLLDHKVSDPAVVLKALIAFAAFCFAASGAYVMNDLFDHRADRIIRPNDTVHSRRRPSAVPSGC